LITIDAPEFSLRLAKIIHAKSDIPTVHYVAPTVWAWRPKRADKMAQFIDHVLALFPFEPPLMQGAGMSCDFVGHPVVTDPIATDEEAVAFRDDFGIGDAPLRQSMPDLQCVLPAAPHVVGAVQEAVQNWPIRPIVLDHREMGESAYDAAKSASFRAADVALAASGTVSLELAANDTPMVIAYDMGWLSRQIIGRALCDTMDKLGRGAPSPGTQAAGSVIRFLNGV